MEHLMKYGVCVKSWAGVLDCNLTLFASMQGVKAYCNEQWYTGAQRISIFQRAFGGWEHIETKDRSPQAARAQYERYIKELAAKVPDCVISWEI